MKKTIIILTLLAAVVVFYFYNVGTEQCSVPISSFSTSLADRDTAQIQNITQAARKTNNIRLKPGEIFSFNGTVGKRSPDAYQKSKTVVGAKVEDTTGGGICQLSSTLYNAALAAGLKIIERHPHNIIVHSVGPGLDATVSYGFYDLKFQNTYNFPVKITAKISGTRLIVNLVGAAYMRPLQINIIVEPIPTYNKNEIRVRVWRETISPSGEKKKELISEDAYTR